MREAPSKQQQAADLRPEFNRRYSAALDVVLQGRLVPNSSLFPPLAPNRSYPEYRALVELGPPAVPFLLEKAATGQDMLRGQQLPWFALGDITKIEPPFLRIGAKRPDPERVRSTFEKHYREWKEATTASTQSQAIERLKGLGPDATSLVFEKVLGGDDGLSPLLEDLQRAEGRMWVIAWCQDRDRAASRFAQAYQEWRSAGTVGERAKAWAQIRSLGVDALPWIVEKLEEGEQTLLPLFDDLTDGKAIKPEDVPSDRARLAARWWDGNKVNWTIPPISAASFQQEKH
jgi:hypothetical protein